MAGTGYENIILDIGLEAASTLAAKQFRAVKLNASHQIVICNTAGEAALGILVNDPAAGETGRVCLKGICQAVYGGSITEGDALTIDANGDVVTKTTDAQYQIGRALHTGVDNDVRAIEVFPVAGGTLAGQAKGYVIMPISLNLSAVADGAVGDSWVPGFAGRIVSCHARSIVAASTGGKASTITPAIGGTPTTGGAIALTTAAMATTNKKVDGTAITAANTFTAASAITLVASSTTAFVEGTATVYLVCSVD